MIDKGYEKLASKSMKSRLRPIVTGFLKMAVSLGLLYWFISTDRLPLEQMRMLAQWHVIALGLLLIGVNLTLSSERWRAILHSQGFYARFFPTLKMTLVGNFFSFFMPGGVGGDVIKAYYVVQNLDKNKSQAVATVIFDRILGLFTMVLMAFVACLVEYEFLLQNPTVRSFFVILTLITTAFLTLFFLLWSRRTVFVRDFILAKVTRIPFLYRNLRRVNQFGLRKRQFVQIIALSFLAQAVSIVFFISIANALGFVDIPLAVFLFVVPMGFIATALPISPGGIGVGQAAFFFLFNLALGRETEVGSVVITAFQAFLLAYGLIGAILYVFIRQHLAIHDPTEQELQSHS